MSYQSGLITKKVAFPSREKQDKTYRSAESFLMAMRTDTLIEGFFLTEEVFQDLMGRICLDKYVSENINDNGVLILLKADRGSEVDGLVAFAQGVVDGNKLSKRKV